MADYFESYLSFGPMCASIAGVRRISELPNDPNTFTAQFQNECHYVALLVTPPWAMCNRIGRGGALSSRDRTMPQSRYLQQHMMDLLAIIYFSDVARRDGYKSILELRRCLMEDNLHKSHRGWMQPVRMHLAHCCFQGNTELCRSGVPRGSFTAFEVYAICACR